MRNAGAVSDNGHGKSAVFAQQHERSNGHSVFDRFLTPKETAEILQVKVSWLYQQTRRRSQDRIPHVKIGHYVRFREADLAAYIERHTVKG